MGIEMCDFFPNEENENPFFFFTVFTNTVKTKTENQCWVFKYFRWLYPHNKAVVSTFLNVRYFYIAESL